MVADVISSHGAKDRDKENHFIQNYGIDDVSGITQRDVVSDSIANLTSLIPARSGRLIYIWNEKPGTQEQT